jgi:hypothetical protein
MPNRKSSSSSSRSSSSKGRSSSSKSKAHTTTDHDEIRRWAEERGGKPSCVIGTGGGDDPGLLRIDFPDYSGEGSLEPITWGEFFQKFDENNLALLYEEKTKDGQPSNFNKLVKRDDGGKRRKSHGRDAE